MRSKVFYTSSERVSTTHSYLDERYSADQKRARISYQRAIVRNSNQAVRIAVDRGDLIHDAGTGWTLDVGYYCAEVERADLRLKFIGHPITVLDEIMSKVDSHIVGPAGLLLAVDQMRNKMKMKSIEESKDRNRISVPYVLDIETKSGETLSLDVEYDKILLTPGSDPLPSALTFTVLDVSFRIEYTQPSLLSSADMLEEIEAGNLLHDIFSMRTFAQCSKQLKVEGENLFESTSGMKRFSFRAIHEIKRAQITSQLSYYVAYDQGLDLMRFDIIPRSRGSHVRDQVFSFKMNRMYSVAKLDEDDHEPARTNLGYYLLNSKSRKTSDGMTLDTQCVVSRIFPAETEKKVSTKPLSLGRLLAGSDRFVYMGKAKVRGISARIYEASDVEPPYWLDPSISILFTDGKVDMREPSTGADRKIYLNQIVVVLYFAETDSTEAPNGALLMVQLSRLVNNRIIDKQTVELYDFQWDIEDVSPRGDRAVQMFTVADSCSKRLGFNQYARIDLLVEQDQSSLDAKQVSLRESLSRAHRRNLAILGALQTDLNLPSTMIYDLESKPITKTFAAMEISFRVAEHTQNLIEFTYLGRGRPEYGKSRRQIVTYRRSFQSCAFSAAHMLASTHFGYEPKTFKCITEMEPPPSDTSGNDQFTFALDDDEKMEIYRIQHLEVAMGKCPWLRGRSLLKNGSMFEGQQLELKDSKSGQSLKFTIKLVEIDTDDYRSAMTTDSLSIDNLVSETKITGFAIPNGSPQSKNIKSSSAIDDLWSDTSRSGESSLSKDITASTCELACLLDLDCKSYSFCPQILSEQECRTSTLSFNSPYVLSQLSSALKLQRDGPVTIKMSPESTDVEVKLVKQARCDLYNKKYMKLFEKSGRFKVDLGHHQYKRVSSMEQCAEMCASRNMYQSEDSRSASQPEILGAIDRLTLNGSDINELKRNIRLISDSFCRGFVYINGKVEAKLGEEIKQQLNDDQSSMEQYAGYCALEGGLSSSFPPPGTHKGQISVSRYAFRLDLFYEKRLGLRLDGVPYDKTVNEDGSTSVDSANQQVILKADTNTCARMCFSQEMGPAKGCRSFDIELRSPADGGAAWCFLNSMTLNDVITSQYYNLVIDKVPLGTRVWHFEPRVGSIFAKLLAKVDELDARRELNAPTIKDNSFRLGAFAIFFVVILSKITGLFVGLQYGGIILRKLRLLSEEKQQDTEGVILHRSISFENSVNYEGQMPS